MLRSSLSHLDNYGTILTWLKGAGGHWNKYLEEKNDQILIE